jgi:hypothetical protein
LWDTCASRLRNRARGYDRLGRDDLEVMSIAIL